MDSLHSFSVTASAVGSPFQGMPGSVSAPVSADAVKFEDSISLSSGMIGDVSADATKYSGEIPALTLEPGLSAVWSTSYTDNCGGIEEFGKVSYDSAVAASACATAGPGGKILSFVKKIFGVFSSGESKKAQAEKNKDAEKDYSLAENYEGNTHRTARYVINHGIHERSEVDKYGMTFDDVVRICDYTADAYKDINAALRSDDAEQREKLMPVIEKTVSALEKLPSNSKRVFRGGFMPDEFFSSHSVGRTVTYEAFTSTSSDPEQKFSGNTEITIVPSAASRGKDVCWASRYAYENEVLFPPETSFIVTNHVEKSGRHYITLQEVPATPKES